LDRPDPFAALFQEIAEIARVTLRQSPYLELRELSCDYSGGVLTLRGHLPTYHLKQLAQATVAELPGVLEVHNHVKVVPPRPAQNRGWTQPSTLLSTQAS